MKKLLSILLTLCMIFVFATLTGCDSDDASSDSKPNSSAQDSQTPESSEENEEGNVGSVYPEALKDVTAIAAPEIDYTAWDFAGGCVDGTEMNEAEAQAVLDIYGGRLSFEIGVEGNIELIGGDQYAQGTYTLTTDGFGYIYQFENGQFYAVFTEVEGETVMMLANPEKPGTALYFIQAVRG